MRHFILLFFLLVQTSVFSQGKQMSLEDAVYGRYTYLKPEALAGLSWKNEAVYTFVEDNKLVAGSVKSNEERTLLSLNEMNEITDQSFLLFPNYRWLDGEKLLVSNPLRFWVIDLENKKTDFKIELPKGASNANYSDQGDFVCFTKDDNLYIAHKTKGIKQISNDGGNGIKYGQTVHRNEFGISGGIYISPKGNYIAFYRKDESMVEDYPLVDFMACEAHADLVKYPMAGMNSHHVSLGIYNIKTGNVIFLKTGEPLDHFLTNVAWSSNEKNIYMAELNREQNQMQLNCYDVATGEKTRTLFEEKSDKYVEPLHPIQFSKVNENEFYYLSRKDGWFHVYKYNTKGQLLQQITKGKWEVTDILGFDEKEKNIFVVGTKEGPLQKHIYKVEQKTGEITRLSEETGIHSGILSPNASFVLDEWNAKNVAGKTDLISAKGKVVRHVFEANDPLKGYELGENKLVALKTKDGKEDLFARLILPENFDPSKKYPVIIYVYGGPHSQLVTKGWHNSARWWQYYMASKGYIAFTLDNRGTNNRGRAFETAIHRQLGTLETEDQIQGLEYLKSLPYIDGDRIGVHGWSYGGFMTLNLKLKYPEIFKVAVAGGPVVDWSLYEIMYGERYMDKPQENPEGYMNSDMTNYVKNLDGKLMLIHGVQDATVVMQHSMKFLRECVKQNKQVDFFAYPTHPHNVRGKDRVHLMKKVSLYFEENL